MTFAQCVYLKTSPRHVSVWKIYPMITRPKSLNSYPEHFKFGNTEQQLKINLNIWFICTLWLLLVHRGIKKDIKPTNQPTKDPPNSPPNSKKWQVFSGCSRQFLLSSIKMTPYTNVSYGGKALQRKTHIPSFSWHFAKAGLPLFSANQALLYLLLGYHTGHIPAGYLTHIPVLLDESHFEWFVQSTPRIVTFQISHGSFGWKHSNDFNLNTFKTTN